MPITNPRIQAVSVSNTLFSSGTYRLTGGPGVTVGSDASGGSVSGQAFSLIASNSTFTSGNFRVSGGQGITVSSDASGAVLHGGMDGSFFENGVPDVGAMALGSTSLNTNLAGGRLLLQPVSPSNELFPMDMSVTRAMLNFSGNFTAGSTTNASAAFTSSFFLGFYTRNNSTQLGLLNSASRAITAGANLANSSLLGGARYLSFHSSIFSSAPNFSEGARYWFGQLIVTSGAIYTGPGAVMSQFGLYQGASTQRSGDLGVAAASNTSSNAWYPFMGVHSLTTHTALPATLGNADINKASINANFIPHLLLNGGLAPLD